MAARYYCADSENGDHVDDPSEDALFLPIGDLNDSENTFVVAQPEFASVAVLEEGGYEVVGCPRFLEHGLTASGSHPEVYFAEWSELAPTDPACDFAVPLAG
ncbi:hypothetical protein HYE82_11725 [Streptomyces sp. BR123]|uniref:hypothetical protein n=1 Tax=Streptomyces sp. BR123 TaxID=2749828 RepID=UPI0015C42A03|nr:hypothetical protein [Streptomyces sp. BR123]NXY95052.1 hypothetical protein [Streptomyces sp. BR123]